MSIDVHTIERPDGSQNAWTDRNIDGIKYLSNPSSPGAIATVTPVLAGSFATLPVMSTTGPGSGNTFVVHMKALTGTVVTPQSSTGSYAPGDTITCAGATGTEPVLTVTHTKVNSATVAAGGTGGTNGTQTVVGTTGTGTKFQATVTVTGGAITAVLAIAVAGDYTANPSSLTAEPVTGAGLSGAQLSVKMGVLTATVTTPGDLTVLASNPVAQGSTSGSGTGATFNLTYGILSITVGGSGTLYDSTSAIVSTPSGGATFTFTLSNTNGVVVMPVTWTNLPNPCHITANIGQAGTWFVPFNSIDETGFDLHIIPPSSGAIAAGTISVQVNA